MERERIRETDQERHVNVYETPGRTTTATERERVVPTEPVASTTAGAFSSDVVIRSADQVRWGPILAGLFTAITTLVVLSLLGLAIGVAAVDAANPLSGLGVGAGWWGAISALIAFGVGGYMAGGTAIVRGSDSGMLNGALVWLVAIPLVLWLLASGIGFLLGTTGTILGAAGEAATGALTPSLQATAQAGATAAGEAVQEGVAPGQVAQAAEAVGRTAWSTLLWMGLGAAAAIGGGFLGGRTSARSGDHRGRRTAHA